MVEVRNIKPEMPVVCSQDGEFAKVDHMEGDKTIKLMRDKHGQHHFIPLSWVTSTDNLGTGIRYSTLEMVNTFAKVSGQTVPYKVVARRLGDVAQCYADTRLAHDLIDWDAKRNIAQMCADAWHWQEKTSEVR